MRSSFFLVARLLHQGGAGNELTCLKPRFLYGEAN